jgi:hypothetical protein
MMNSNLDNRSPAIESRVYYRAFSSYHELRRHLPTMSRIAIECVFCRNTSDSNPLALLDNRKRLGLPLKQEGLHCGEENGEHVAYVLPCGHLAGFSCLKVDHVGRCPACDIIWRRAKAGREGTGECAHNLVISPLSLTEALGTDEAEWLVPPGGYVPDKCRYCATKEALQELTRMLRKGAPRERFCSYATDGVVHGFLDGDQLKPFTTLDIAMGPAMLPAMLTKDLEMRERAIQAKYDGRTPWAETRVTGAVNGAAWKFRVAGLARPLSEWRIGQEAD